ncbi:MAG: TrmB family transcriptional regulator [Candidatus Nanoarchaeia archaeon]
MIEQVLESIGLTKGEIRVYSALLELGQSSTGSITKKSKISGSKVYEVLDRLMEKGLVSTIIKNNVRYFEASNPHKILSYVNEKQAQVEKEKDAVTSILPLLLAKAKDSKSSSARIFVGWEGLKTANDDIINSLSRGEEWLSMGLTEQPKSWELYFTNRQKERAKKGIAHRHLLNKKYRALYENRKGLPHTTFRFLSENFEMPLSTEIYGNKVAFFILLKEDPMAIIIESKPMHDSFKKYFEILWKLAELPKNLN